MTQTLSHNTAPVASFAAMGTTTDFGLGPQPQVEYVERVPRTSNVGYLPAALDDKLQECLLGAVKSGKQAMVDKVLNAIVEKCPHGFFVTPFRNGTLPAGLLIGRLRELGRFGTFYLYWSNNGAGDEAWPAKHNFRTHAPKTAVPRPARAKATPAVVEPPTPEALELLRNQLLAAVASSSQPRVDEALQAIGAVLPARSTFVTPFRKGTRTSGWLVSRLLALRTDTEMLFHLDWTEDGIGDEVRGSALKLKKAPASDKPKPSRAELDARKAASRAARIAAQPAKGKSGGGDTPKKGKKGGK